MVPGDFQADANGPDVFWQKRPLLTDNAPLVPGWAARANGG
ncbi:hypothetical protein RBY4I_1277 [Rhodobacterales bacterium Y4I]|nr:hypothetical protein RBY4I_1277 [Rhodobacterales bacterium Y4I]